MIHTPVLLSAADGHGLASIALPVVQAVKDMAVEYPSDAPSERQADQRVLGDIFRLGVRGSLSGRLRPVGAGNNIASRGYGWPASRDGGITHATREASTLSSPSQDRRLRRGPAIVIRRA
jgi:hypothetical protein